MPSKGSSRNRPPLGAAASLSRSQPKKTTAKKSTTTRSSVGRARPTPWWLADGDEECLACGQSYIYELEFHCPECDTVTCLHCRRQRADGRLVCVSCAEAGSTREASHGR